jgi:hypothetical protein
MNASFLVQPSNSSGLSCPEVKTFVVRMPFQLGGGNLTEQSESGPLVTRLYFVMCNSLVTSEGHVVGTSVREDVCEGEGGDNAINYEANQF